MSSRIVNHTRHASGDGPFAHPSLLTEAIAAATDDVVFAKDAMLVKRLVDLHDGRIEARSAGVGLGSRFVVTLPPGPSSSP